MLNKRMKSILLFFFFVWKPGMDLLDTDQLGSNILAEVLSGN